MLCLVEHALERFLAGVALVLYVLCHMDELSLYGIFFYDIGIVLDVGKYDAVLLMIKILLKEHLAGGHYGILAHNHGADHGLLCLKAVWHYSFD